MGCVCSTPRDPNAQKATPSTYPKNPAYANTFTNQHPAPLVVPGSGMHYNEGVGEGVLMGAALTGHTPIQPAIYNPVSGDYGY